MTSEPDDTQTRPAAPRAPTRAMLISKMFRLLDRKITQLEMTMDEPVDKEVAVLGSLTRSLKDLIELDLKEKSRTGKKTRRGDMDALRQKLAERIEQLSRD